MQSSLASFVFLDLDGPVLDVATRYHAVYRDILAGHGLLSLSRFEYWARKRRQVPEWEIVALTAPALVYADYLQARLGLIETSAYLRQDTVQLGARETLDTLAAAHPLVVVTLRNDRAALLEQLEALALAPFFTAVLSHGDDDTRPRPTIKRDLVVSRFGQSYPRSSIFVGDTETDIEGGKLLGLRTVAVACGIRERERLAAYSPDWLLDQLSEIPSIYE